MVLVGDTARVPLVAFVPVQLPEAVHEIALVEDQVTTEALPEAMLVGLAENVTVGARPPRRKSTKFRRLPSGPSSVEKSEPFTAAPAVAIILAAIGPDTAGEASTKGESAIIEASALAN